MAIDIVEIFNDRSSDDANQRAKELCSTLRAVPGAGSDAHRLDQIGQVYVELEAFEEAQDFLEKLEFATIVHQPSQWRMNLEGRVRSIRGAVQ